MSLILFHSLVDSLALVLNCKLELGLVRSLPSYITLSNVNFVTCTLKVVVWCEESHSLHIENQVVTQSGNGYFLRVEPSQFLRNKI